MKYITFPASGILAGIAQMLTHYGLDVEDRDIALGMEAPYLLLHEGEAYYAGSGLYRPQWLALYLQPRGLRLRETTICKDGVPAFLRSNSPAMLTLTLEKGVRHPVIFEHYENARYEFLNIKRRYDTSEIDSLSLSTYMLKKRLDEEVIILTLERCEPAPADPIPYLFRTLNTLDQYCDALLAARELNVTRESLQELAPIFRAIMQDMHPMAVLIGDRTLAEELRYLMHDYRHIFFDGQVNVLLRERIPKSSIRKCLSWLREDIIDRLFELGLDDESIAARLNESNSSHDAST